VLGENWSRVTSFVSRYQDVVMVVIVVAVLLFLFRRIRTKAAHYRS